MENIFVSNKTFLVLIGNYKKQVIIILLLIQVTAIFEAVGISMFMPLLQGTFDISETSQDSRKYISSILQPIEVAISDFAIEVLRGVKSFFVDEHVLACPAYLTALVFSSGLTKTSVLDLLVAF